MKSRTWTDNSASKGIRMEIVDIFLISLGFVCLLEALPWLIAPEKMRDFLEELLRQDVEDLRKWGIFLMVLAITFLSLSTL